MNTSNKEIYDVKCYLIIWISFYQGLVYKSLNLSSIFFSQIDKTTRTVVLYTEWHV